LGVAELAGNVGEGEGMLSVGVLVGVDVGVLVDVAVRVASAV